METYVFKNTSPKDGKQEYFLLQNTSSDTPPPPTTHKKRAIFVCRKIGDHYTNAVKLVDSIQKPINLQMIVGTKSSH